MRMRARRLGFSLALCLFACSDEPTLIGVRAANSVEPPRIDFGSVPAGDAVERSVWVRNTGEATVAVTLSVDGPYRLSERELRLAPGERQKIGVALTEDARGRAEGAVRVLGDRDIHVVSLIALVAVPCAKLGPCIENTLDTTTGACVAVVAPDGTTCASDNACLAAGRCVGGQCLGEAVVCNDGISCTLDVCTSAGECAVLPDDTACRTANPCQLGRCDPHEGCVVGSVDDGTPCGPRTCSTAAAKCRHPAFSAANARRPAAVRV